MDMGTIPDDSSGLFATETKSHPSLVVLSGSQTGQSFPLQPGRNNIGRSRQASLFLDDESVSRKHAEFIVSLDGKYYIRDLGSTNGVRVNGTRIGPKPRRIFIGDRIRLSCTVAVKLRTQDSTEEHMQQTLYNLALHDPLTGAFNKRYFAERIEQEIAFAQRHRRPLSLVIFDLDHFKQLNDQYGHSAGDAVLRKVSEYMKENLRIEDVFSRFGGEEFVILMRDTTLEHATQVSQRLLQGIAKMNIQAQGESIQVTISIGIGSTEEDPGSSSMDLFTRADRRLYKAKNAGRNQVCAA